MSGEINKIENRDLSFKSLNINELIDKSNLFLKISTRAADDATTSLGQFSIFDEKKLSKLAEDMTEVNRATNSFGRSNSQVSDKLMSLTMIAYNPYRFLHQCLAKIESRRSAIRENQYRLRKLQIEISQLQLQKKELLYVCTETDTKTQLQISLLTLEIEEKAVSLNDAMLYLEGALKEIAVYQDSYKQIKVNHNIPDKWDEKDFEEAEIEHHVKMAFLNGVRDIISSGRLNMGTLEYMQQFGIHPITAASIITNYLEDCNDNIRKKESFPNIKHLNEFLDSVYNAFKDTYKDQMEFIGLTRLITDDCLFLDGNAKNE